MVDPDHEFIYPSFPKSVYHQDLHLQQLHRASPLCFQAHGSSGPLVLCSVASAGVVGGDGWSPCLVPIPSPVPQTAGPAGHGPQLQCHPLSGPVVSAGGLLHTP